MFNNFIPKKNSPLFSEKDHDHIMSIIHCIADDDINTENKDSIGCDVML